MVVRNKTITINPWKYYTQNMLLI